MSKTNDPPPEAADVPVLVSIRLRNEKMVAARERRNYSQKLLAAITGVSVHTIGRLERFDLTSADVADRIDALADALGLTADDIAPPTMIGKEINHTLYSVENIAPEKLQRLNSPVARYTLPSPAAQAAQAAATDALRFGQAQARIDGPEARVAASIADAIVRRADVAAAKAKDSATNAIAQAARAGRKGW